MPKRFIGDAMVSIDYRDSERRDGDHRDGAYYCAVYVPKGAAAHYVWRFDDLYPPRFTDFGAYDSAVAYDEMAGAAVSFGAYGEFAPPEIAEAIADAVSWAQDDQGNYNVRRTRPR